MVYQHGLAVYPARREPVAVGAWDTPLRILSLFPVRFGIGILPQLPGNHGPVISASLYTIKRLLFPVGLLRLSFVSTISPLSANRHK
jgi:hypothetical protein